MIEELVFFNTVFVHSLPLPLKAEFFVFCELLRKIQENNEMLAKIFAKHFEKIGQVLTFSKEFTNRA
jgi:hypothetical protein